MLIGKAMKLETTLAKSTLLTGLALLVGCGGVGSPHHGVAMGGHSGGYPRTGGSTGLGAGGAGARDGSVDSRSDVRSARTDASASDGTDANTADAKDAPSSDVVDAEAPIDTSPGLVGAPLIVAPTATGFGLSAILAGGEPATIRARIRPSGGAAWGPAITPQALGADLLRWQLGGLVPATRYDYQIVAIGGGSERQLYQGSAVTQRPAGQSYTFALITDSHIGAHLSYTNQGNPETLKTVSAELAQSSPDFIVNLGDMLDFHEYGFNSPPPSGAITRLAYLNYRTLLGDTLGKAAHFPVIGNWEGENGDFTDEEIAWSQQQRMLYVPAPEPTTYPESGSPTQDYYAFTWGDALFVVLNVMTYTKTAHLLSADPGLPDDWTLGDDQMAWFEKTLANAKSKWRFVLIHHAVGGAAGDEANAAYGRGGGQAAYVGEQAKVHQLMLQHGVQIFFHGHDHVFTDMKVDGIHYTLPGSAGAIWMFSQSETGYAEQWQQAGWGRVTVTPASVHVELVAKGGEILHQYTLPE